MTIRRVQGFNMPYTYPDHNNVRTTSDSDQTTAPKTSENSPKQTSQIGELKQEGTARSLELNSKFSTSTKQSENFKGDIVGLEPNVKDDQP